MGQVVLDELIYRLKGDTSQLDRDMKRGGVIINRESKKMQRGFAGLNKNVGEARLAFGALGAVVGAVAITKIARAAKEVIQLADRYKLLQARLGIVTDSTTELTRAERELFEISQRTRTSFEATTELFTRVARGRAQLGKSTEELLQFTENIQKLVIVSGASAQEAQAAIIQLSQGLASGQVRGEELRSVMEQLPAVAISIADAMGITIGKFRELSLAGKISAKQIVEAILSQTTAINKDFAQIPTTVGQASQKVANNILRLIGQMDEATDVGGEVAEEINELSSALDDLSVILAVNKGGLEDFKNELKDIANSPAMRVLQAISTAGISELVRAGRGALASAAEAARAEQAARNREEHFFGGNARSRFGDIKGETKPDKDLVRAQKALANLRFEFEQLTRTPLDQAISSALRPLEKFPALAKEGREIVQDTFRVQGNNAVKEFTSELRLTNKELQIEIDGHGELIPLLRFEEDFRRRYGEEIGPVFRGELTKELETRENLSKELEEQQRLQRELESVSVSVARGIEDALVSATTNAANGFEDLRNIALAVMADIQRAIIRATITGPLEKGIADFIGPLANIGLAALGSGGSFGTIPGNVGPPSSGRVGAGLGSRADGGPVAAGAPTLVGERGAEIIVPQVPSTVFSNQDSRAILAGAARPSVNITQSFDFTGANPATVQLLRQETDSIVTRTLGAVRGEIASGGPLARQVGARS